MQMKMMMKLLDYILFSCCNYQQARNRFHATVREFPCVAVLAQDPDGEKILEEDPAMDACTRLLEEMDKEAEAQETEEVSKACLPKSEPSIAWHHEHYYVQFTVRCKGQGLAQYNMEPTLPI